MNYKKEAISEPNVQSQRNELPESIGTNQCSVALFMFMSKLKKYHGTVMLSRYWLTAQTEASSLSSSRSSPGYTEAECE